MGKQGFADHRPSYFVAAAWAGHVIFYEDKGGGGSRKVTPSRVLRASLSPLAGGAAPTFLGGTLRSLGSMVPQALLCESPTSIPMQSKRPPLLQSMLRPTTQAQGDRPEGRFPDYLGTGSFAEGPDVCRQGGEMRLQHSRTAETSGMGGDAQIDVEMFPDQAAPDGPSKKNDGTSGGTCGTTYSTASFNERGCTPGEARKGSRVSFPCARGVEEGEWAEMLHSQNSVEGEGEGIWGLQCPREAPPASGLIRQPSAAADLLQTAAGRKSLMGLEEGHADAMCLLLVPVECPHTHAPLATCRVSSPPALLSTCDELCSMLDEGEGL
jgi:hypothetical protein